MENEQPKILIIDNNGRRKNVAGVDINRMLEVTRGIDEAQIIRERVGVDGLVFHDAIVTSDETIIFDLRLNRQGIPELTPASMKLSASREIRVSNIVVEQPNGEVFRLLMLKFIHCEGMWYLVWISENEMVTSIRYSDAEEIEP